MSMKDNAETGGGDDEVDSRDRGHRRGVLGTVIDRLYTHWNKLRHEIGRELDHFDGHEGD